MTDIIFERDFGPHHAFNVSLVRELRVEPHHALLFIVIQGTGFRHSVGVPFEAVEAIRNAVLELAPLKGNAHDPEEVSTALELLGYLNQVASGDLEWATLDGVKLSRIVNSDGETAAEEELRQTKQLLEESNQRYAELAGAYPGEVKRAIDVLKHVRGVKDGDGWSVEIEGVKISPIDETGRTQSEAILDSLAKQPLLPVPEVELGEISLDPTDFDYRTKALELAIAGNAGTSSEDLVSRAAVLESFLRNGKQDESTEGAKA